MKFIIILLLSIIAVFSRYDEQLSEDLYQYSRVAFCSDELINDWSCDACQKNPGTIATKVLILTMIRLLNLTSLGSWVMSGMIPIMIASLLYSGEVW